MINRKESIEGWGFVLPYLSILFIFLIFPFIKGIWISLHDWDLLRVLFNPASKKFVGLENYIELFWGENLTWSISHNFFLRIVSLALLAYVIYYACAIKKITLSLFSIISLTLGFVIVVIAMGIHPSEIGRWNDLRFWAIFKNTFTFVLFTVPLVTITSLLVAIMLQKVSKANTVLRVLFFMSNVLSVTVVTLIWQILYSPNQGMIANILRALHLEPIKWVTSPLLAMPSIIIVTVWWSLGFAMIIFIAGLQDIPPEQYEAAKLDGANSFEIFRYITVPGISRTITLVIIIEIILHFQVFGQAHLITQGGPGDATQVLVRYIYQTGFRDSRLGSAAALSFVLFMIMMLVSFLQIKFSRTQDNEE